MHDDQGEHDAVRAAQMFADSLTPSAALAFRRRLLAACTARGVTVAGLTRADVDVWAAQRPRKEGTAARKQLHQFIGQAVRWGLL